MEAIKECLETEDDKKLEKVKQMKKDFFNIGADDEVVNKTQFKSYQSIVDPEEITEGWQMRRLLEEIRSFNNERENRMYGINALTDLASDEGRMSMKKRLKKKLKEKVTE